MEPSAFRHSIKVVAERTGLSPHVIRIWEKRYGVTEPERSGGNQRLYREEDIERLSLLRHVTEAGHPIRTVAQLSPSELRRLLESESTRATGGDVTARSTAKRPLPPLAPQQRPLRSGPELVEAAFQAVAALNAGRLEDALDEASVSLGQVALLSQVIAPLVKRIGDAWQAGTLKAGHEHLASATLRTFLGNAAKPFAVHPSAPMLIATTPNGQLHEIGAALVAAAATHLGWRVTYLGPSLPADEIASAALQNQARAVALSIVHPSDDLTLAAEFERLRRLLPPTVALIAGGAAAPAYESALRQSGFVLCHTLAELTHALDDLRQASN